jgi:probable HAF family extracellular repeat protein
MWFTKHAAALRNCRRKPARNLLRLLPLDDRLLPSYTVVDLGAWSAFSLNNAGQIAGTNGDAVLWDNGNVIHLGAGAGSSARGINDAGQVAGFARFGGSSTMHAFFWDASSGLTDLGVLPNRPYSQATDFNLAGQVVGTSKTVNSTNDLVGGRAFVWDSASGMQDVSYFGSSTTACIATAINSNGQIAGYSEYSQPGDMTSYFFADSAFFRDQYGTTTPIGPLPGWTYSKALDNNDLGQVVGSSGDTQFLPHSMTYRPQQAFIWQNGVITGLGAPPGYPRSEAVAINNLGQVICAAVQGTYSTYPIYGGRAFLWENGVWTDLGFNFTAADINDQGQILISASGHSCLLNPVTIPTVSISDVSVSEGNSGTGSAVFTVTRAGPLDQLASVVFTTADGSATAGSDYLSVAGTLTFKPGQDILTVSVPHIGDRLAESNETFTVNLSESTNVFITDAQGLGTIIDDEPRISISDVSRLEGSRGQTTLFVFTVTLSAAYDQPVTMSYRTVNGSAQAGSDYLTASGTLTFNPGETQTTITIVVNGDNKRESDETFYVDLFGNSGNSLFTKNRGIGTILNDD